MASAAVSWAALMNSSGGVRHPSSTTLNPALRKARESILVPMTWASLPTVPVMIVACLAIVAPLPAAYPPMIFPLLNAQKSSTTTS